MKNQNVLVLAIAVALVATSVASVKPFGGQSLKLLVIGGRINVDDDNMEVISDVEKIDISKEGSEGSNCVKPQDYPIKNMAFSASNLKGNFCVQFCILLKPCC